MDLPENRGREGAYTYDERSANSSEYLSHDKEEIKSVYDPQSNLYLLPSIHPHHLTLTLTLKPPSS